MSIRSRILTLTSLLLSLIFLTAQAASGVASLHNDAIAPTAKPMPTWAMYMPLVIKQSSLWINIVEDRFDTGGVPAHWTVYDGPYGSGVHSCAVPSHVTVSDGYLHLLMAYESSGKCGAGWYTGGMKISAANSGVDQRVSLRFRIVNKGVTSHHIIAMRWPEDSANWPATGEEDYCENDNLNHCSFFLHYSSNNSQIYHDLTIDLSQWHVMRVERVNHVVKIYLDESLIPAWTYTGNSTTLPDTLKHVVLQQECNLQGCPAGTTGSEDIQIDWLTIDNPNPNSGSTATPTASPSPTPTSNPSTPTKTPTPASGSVIVVAVGDINAGSSGATANRVTLDAVNPVAILGLGDYQYTVGDCANFLTSGHWDSNWGAENWRFWPTFGPTHDYNPSSASRANDYFSGNCAGQTKPESPAATMLGGTLGPMQPYSFDVNGWHIIQLPTTCYRYGTTCDSNAITTWLINDLNTHPTQCSIAFFHEPYWTSTTTTHARVTYTKPWVQVLYDHGVELLLQGHNHDYERFYPQNMSDQRDDTKGITSFVVGTGGVGFYPFTNTAPNSAARNDATYGVLKLTLGSGVYSWQFLPIAGKTFTDSGNGTCH